VFAAQEVPMTLPRFLAAALLLALAACGSTGGVAPGGVAPDMQNPQRPQAGPPFPYNTNGW
jgi:hypothetical protein